MSNILPTFTVIEQHMNVMRCVSAVDQAMAELNDAVDLLRDQLDELGLPTTIPDMAAWLRKNVDEVPVAAE